MNALKPYAPSKAARAIIAASRRALSAPAPRLPMCGDPNFMQIETLREGRAMLERRACQYAAWLAAAKFPTLNLARLNARFDGASAAPGESIDFSAIATVEPGPGGKKAHSAF